MTLRCPERGTARPCPLSKCSLIDCQLLQGFQTSLGGRQGLCGRALPTHTRCTLRRATSIVKAAAGYHACSQDNGNEGLPSIGSQRLLKRLGRRLSARAPPAKAGSGIPPPTHARCQHRAAGTSQAAPTSSTRGPHPSELGAANDAGQDYIEAPRRPARAAAEGWGRSCSPAAWGPEQAGTTAAAPVPVTGAGAAWPNGTALPER